MRAFGALWTEICRDRYGVTDPKLSQFRYGVQVNSLGLTEQQPENEALSLPRPWDQQWSLRLQQILAYETDLLEYGDLFTGNPVVEAKVASLCDAAKTELAQIDDMGGIRAAIETGYCKR